MEIVSITCINSESHYKKREAAADWLAGCWLLPAGEESAMNVKVGPLVYFFMRQARGIDFVTREIFEGESESQQSQLKVTLLIPVQGK